MSVHRRMARHLRQTDSAGDGRRSGDHGSRSGAWRLALTALAGLVAVYAVFAGTGPGRQADAEVLQRDVEGRSEWLAQILAATLRPSLVALIVMVLCLIAVLDRRPADALRAVVLVGAAVALSRLGKDALEALDPMGVEPGRALGSGWYPSGHAAVVMSLGLAAVLVAPAVLRSPALLAATGGGPAIVGWAILADHEHHASDVAGGVLLAILISSVLVIGRRGPAQPPCRLPWRAVAVVIAALAAAAGLLAAVEDLRVPRSILQPEPILAGAAVAVMALAGVDAFDRALAGEASVRRGVDSPNSPRPTHSAAARAPSA